MEKRRKGRRGRNRGAETKNQGRKYHQLFE